VTFYVPFSRIEHYDMVRYQPEGLVERSFVARGIPTQRTRLHGDGWWSAFHLHRRHIALRRLRDARRGRSPGERLSEGGEKQRCGWLKDRFGVSWQIIPSALGEMMQDKDPEKSKRVMEAMLKMDKIDIKTLRQAYDQG
jgi:hypothetical protein